MSLDIEKLVEEARRESDRYWQSFADDHFGGWDHGESEKEVMRVTLSLSWAQWCKFFRQWVPSKDVGYHFIEDGLVGLSFNNSTEHFKPEEHGFPRYWAVTFLFPEPLFGTRGAPEDVQAVADACEKMRARSHVLQRQRRKLTKEAKKRRKG